MPDRLLRADLFESDRWLDLPSTDARLLFVYLLTVADDYGNLDDSRRLFRAARNFVDVKKDEDLQTLLGHLVDADLIRGYGLEETPYPQDIHRVIHRRYWHIPRFKNSRRYWSRKCPKSPFDETDRPTSLEELQDVTEKPAADIPQDSGRPAASLARGVGVGVGVGVEENTSTSTREPPRQPEPKPAATMPAAAAFLAEKVQPPTPAASEHDADRRAAIAKRATQIAVLVIGEERKRKKQARIQPSDPLLLKWAEQGITDAQMLLAYGQAVARREADGDPSAINAGLLDAILPSILAPPRKRRDTAWKRTPEGVAKKARELGWTVPAGWSAQQAIERLESMDAGHD